MIVCRSGHCIDHIAVDNKSESIGFLNMAMYGFSYLYYIRVFLWRMLFKCGFLH